eukprot:m.481428 g.481428  ORF g.481428 m.481428 type:complete len:476 (+) comp22167_c0_seq1:153-1580(+)
MSTAGVPLSKSTANPHLVKAEYGVRGQLYIAGQKRQAEGKEVIFTNSGNPHALGQKPLTFPRQVLSLVSYPKLLEDPVALSKFPADAVKRARAYIKATKGTGAYQDSKGNALVRQEVADFLQRRDGYPADPQDVFLTDGASQGISLCLNMLIRKKTDGILLPCPQYPLYSASVEAHNGTIVSYLLDEDNNWSVSLDEMKRAVRDARKQGICVRGLVYINPGNPTGQMLSGDNISAIVRWCEKEHIVIVADEVYQDNVYVDRPWVSTKKVVRDLKSNAQCFAFHTVSKGAYGECGRRGGLFECINMSEEVKALVYKVMSFNLSTNVDGQIFVGLMCNPPKFGDESYPLFKHESDSTIASLRRRAQIMSKTFNAIPGLQCNVVEGALYAFPRIDVPPLAMQKAKKAGIPPDTLYCLELLDETGISTVPGSSFGQKEGTWHFRTTILPPEEQFPSLMKKFRSFHHGFLKRYGASPAKL